MNTDPVPSQLTKQSDPLDGFEPWEAAVQVGEGGSAMVHRTVVAGEPLALKVARTEDLEPALLHEARQLVMLSSAELPAVRQVGRVPPNDGPIAAGSVFVAFDWIEGEALGSAGQPRPDVALAVARDVGRSLLDVHRAGVAHGDVKPENVLYDGQRAHLVDFGLSAESWNQLPVGATPRYLPPTPGLRGETGQTRDLWAFGLTLAEIALGVPLHEGTLDEATLPEELAAIVRGLTSRQPAARPSAGWVYERASALLAGEGATPWNRERAEAEVRRAYLTARRAELAAISRGAPLVVPTGGATSGWLGDAANLLLQIQRCDRRSTANPSSPTSHSTVPRLDSAQRTRWLLSLVGKTAAGFPALSMSDDDLAAVLVETCQRKAPHAIRYVDLTSRRHDEAPSAPRDIVALVFALGRGGADPDLLGAAEQTLRTEPSATLAVALGRALRLGGDDAHALSVLATVDAPEATLERAETLRRIGDADGCRAALSEIDARSASVELLRRRDAIAGRLCASSGRHEEARRLVAHHEPTAAGAEVLALCALAEGNVEEAKEHGAAARALAVDAEEHARAWGLEAMVAHQAGNHHGALEAYRRAAEHAVRAGAMLEEATYLSGCSAAAANVGKLEDALDAARRATLLFEHLGKPANAARAWLAIGGVYVAAGAMAEAMDANSRALARARACGDVRCQGYAHVNIAAALAAPDREGLEHAQRAQHLLADSPPTDGLLASAMLLRHGWDVDVPALDAAATDPALGADARIEWWLARAESAARRGESTEDRHLLDQLVAASRAGANVHCAGRAFATVAELASRQGDGERTRHFAQRASDAARAVLSGAPVELRHHVEALPWIATLRRSATTALDPEQLTDVEALVRALGTRDRLAPLLNQVLDALVLWTGVERGLLLMNAPNGKLRPRAARNLARQDVAGEQLELSMTLARRAIERGEPVIAVDATNELPEVHRSVHNLKLRSVLAIPLVHRGETLGVVYLDDRGRAGAFGPRELAWVRVVGTLAAVAIADARDQLMLRRAARKARRAEERLAATLATRDAELHVARRELRRTDPSRGPRHPRIVAESEPMQRTLDLVDQVSRAEIPVLILGESGSGKELVARAIHDGGPRSGSEFVSENCSAIPEPLMEATLFGHTRGAFTGASRPRAGLFEIASGGTLFLDEVGEMPEAMQAKLLRVLETGEVRPLGSERVRNVDVRLITATHRDLGEMVAARKFREDLYYRLNVISIPVPALRDRPGDIPLLMQHFLEKHGRGKRLRFSRAAEKLLHSYHWPGNVRQLENEARRLLVTGGDPVLPEHLSPEIVSQASDAIGIEHSLNVRRRVDALESELVADALERTGGNQTRAAQLLGLSRYGLQKMIKRLGIDPGSGRAGHPTN